MKLEEVMPQSTGMLGIPAEGQNNEGDLVDNSGMVSQGGQTEQAQPSEDDAVYDSDDGEDVLPEEQELYDNLVAGAINMMSDKKANAGMIQTLKAGSAKPSESLAKVALMTVMAVHERTGSKVPNDVLMPAAAEILEHVADFAQESGALKIDKKILDDASVYLMRALMEFLKFTPEEIKALQDESPDDVKQLVGVGQPQETEGMI